MTRSRGSWEVEGSLGEEAVLGERGGCREGEKQRSKVNVVGGWLVVMGGMRGLP